jgi:hypothetical protein
MTLGSVPHSAVSVVTWDHEAGRSPDRRREMYEGETSRRLARYC